MDKKDLELFKNKLIQHKMKVINQVQNSLQRDEILMSSDDLVDESDYASRMIQQDMSFSLKERELHKLRQIEQALMKVELGEYGLCEDCGEPINHKRLEKQPWANLCLEHAQEQEERSLHFRKRA